MNYLWRRFSSSINLAILFSSLIFINFPVHAIEETGAEILNTCLSEPRALAGDAVQSVRYGLCLGYLKGIADVLNGKFFCLPQTGETVLITQRLKQVYIGYALSHREQLNQPARHTFLAAFQAAFPCH
ncbi:MAG: Rap1a/Tai family immunity protein [Pseudomonadota bacterium]